MKPLLFRFGTPALAVSCIMMIVLIMTNRELPASITDAFTGSANLQSFKILFISIILEAFPFILLGVLFSALLQVFVTDETIRRWTPRNPVAGVLFGGLLGIVFPLCECGMIPVIRRLIRKGMPAYIGIVYLLAGPIVNPIVYASTYSAFRTSPEIAYSRMAVAFAVAVTAGALLNRFMKGNPLRDTLPAVATPQHAIGHAGHEDHQRHTHVAQHVTVTGAALVGHVSRTDFRTAIARPTKLLRDKAAPTLAHASDEFFEMGKYLIFGALLTAMIQTAVNRSTLAAFADETLPSYLFMMFFAYILSICSTSDAFIAASFSGIFQQGPLLAFLVFGPMIDFKNTLMLLSTFKAKFVLLLTALTAVLTLAGALLAEVFL